MIRYTLSSRLRKDVYVQGKELLLALPAPPDEPDDLLAWARGVLQDIDPEDVVAAEETEVMVPLAAGGRKLAPQTLTDRLGKIIQEWQREAGQPVVLIAAVVVTLRGRRSVLHTSQWVHWPHGVLVDGVPLFEGRGDPRAGAPDEGREPETEA